MLGHPSEGQQRLRSRHGRCAGRLHLAAQCRLPAGVPGRDLEATHCRDAHANPDETRLSPHHYEYARNGTANLFMLFAPLEGWRHVEVTDHHTAVDYAHVLKDLADRHFPHAKTIVLVQDNLNIHSKASLYEAFPAAEARRLVERFEWHYTPKHGSWLDPANPNSVSSPLSVSIAASQTNRPSSRKSPLGNTTEMPITQRQTGNSQTQSAQFKLKYLYPSI